MAVLFSSCHQKEVKLTKPLDLSVLQDEFLDQICTNCQIIEGPFSFNYQFRTVFFSDEVISLFGELTVHDRLPRGWKRYEGKTLCKIEDKWREIRLCDLFPKEKQQELLRKACESSLKADPSSYFSGNDPLNTKLNYDDISTFVIDEKHLIIVFQPYSVAGGSDGPVRVKIPLELLVSEWAISHPLLPALVKVSESQSFLSSWDLDGLYDSLTKKGAPFPM